MSSTVGCPICIQHPTDPHEIQGCKHIYCLNCISSLRPIDGKFLCPLCRKEFLMEDLEPVKLPDPSKGEESSKESESEDEENEESDSGMTYCMNLTCEPNSGCKKVHVNDICTSPPSKEGMKVEEERKVKEDLPPKKKNTFKMPEDSSYCCDIECPGGSEATCGKGIEFDWLSLSEAFYVIVISDLIPTAEVTEVLSQFECSPKLLEK
ncbi:hypothetical protein Aperf_G00000057964 [Anoplocephala perfoliata]